MIFGRCGLPFAITLNWFTHDDLQAEIMTGAVECVRPKMMITLL